MTSELLQELEHTSRQRADRVLRLRGQLGSAPFEVLIFRGFACSTTHPTAFDPDQSVVPSMASLEQAELLQGPMDPTAEKVLAGPSAPEHFLDPKAWL